MALVSVASIGIIDSSGNRKTLPLYFPATNTLAEIQTEINAFVPLLDTCISGKVADASVTLALTLPGGLKANATGGDNTVHEGALLTFDAANTAFAYSMYIPSFLEALFTGDTVSLTNSAGAAEALISEIEDGGDAAITDRNANDLTAYTVGRRAFRK